jgi:diguanylate cyclase (GGDEF)-like protein
MTRGSWLCPTELDRSRVVDANERVRMIRRIGSGAVGAALIICAPWVGWWTLILFALSTLNFAVVERRIHSSSRPERVSAWAIVITMLLIATGVALSGGPRSPMLPWMVLPAGMVAARFRPRVVIAALVLTILITLVATVGVHPLWALENPVSLIATLALLAGIEISHQARLTGQAVCLVLCDVDSFKEVNDEHGHDRGDAVLRDIAYELRKRLRSFELVYRLGGEEFLTVLPGINLQEGEEVAERLREAVEQARPTDIPITISLGVSAARGAQVDYDTLFKAADEALYEAKRTGRNRVVAAPEQASGVDVLPSTDIAPSTPPVVSDALAPQLVG